MQSLWQMFIVLSVLWGPTIFSPCTCTVALKQSQGDPDRCWMVVLSWVHRGLFSLKVISSRSHIITHFDVIAYSCGWQISEMRSLVDIWKEGGHVFLCFKVCWFSASWETQSYTSQMLAISKGLKVLNSFLAQKACKVKVWIIWCKVVWGTYW